MIEEQIKRIVKRLWPELTGDLHLPQWGRVAAVPVAIETAATSTAFEPLYAVDVQVVATDGKDRTDLPVLKSVPLPATGAGAGRGAFSFPQKDTLVELGFIHGSPSKPFIRAVLVENLTIPALGAQDVLLAKDANNHYRIDSNDNIAEQCQAIAERIAKTKQLLKVEDGGTMWVGNEATNILDLVSQLMGVVSAMGATAAVHTHPISWTDPAGNGDSGAPNQAGDFTTEKGDADTLKATLDPILENE